MKIKYVEGDLFQPILAMPPEKTIFIGHVANNLGIMGSGFVVPLAKYFPSAKQEYHKWHEANNWQGKPFQLGETQFVIVNKNPNVIVANMIAQNNVIRNTNGIRPLRYNALAKCMDEVAKVINELEQETTFSGLKDVEIVAPSFGSNLAGGDWNFIAELIQDCWLNKGISVTIHYLKGTLPEIEENNEVA